ncbi:hypothetical protein [Rhodoferax koreensis]|uniref:hypothetical protein n=1 Tax=Rhodoferax koreensis TaxID=1842727 RepID=UPI001EF5A44F|nr:hypothetical protein [Rhodoferax koreense]
MTRQSVASDEALHGVTQMVDLLLIDVLYLRQRGGGIRESTGGNEGGKVRHAPIVQRRKKRER